MLKMLKYEFRRGIFPLLIVFMAPISSYKVIGAKLLSILLTGAIIVAVIFGLLTLDLSLAYSTYDSIDTFYDFLSNILEMGGYSLGGVILRLLAFILVFLIQFFMTITLAYLAV